MKTADQSPGEQEENEIARLEAEIAQLEAAATRSASEQQPDTAHSMPKDYDQICEEIISLKRCLKQLRRS